MYRRICISFPRPASLMLLFCLLAAVYPAMRLLRLKPVDAMRAV